jgi:hypothetical protein
MPNKDIFCNTPWYELHIYHNGDLGICCQESQKLYNQDQQQYNIATMTLTEWFNSQPVKQFRQQLLGNTKSKFCTRCYQEEYLGNNSRRLKSNQKSVIFTRTEFDQSWAQSPGQTQFEFSRVNQGKTATVPIDLHIDLGNFCNMTCKMCCAANSSSIAAQEVKWGIVDSQQYLGTDWTRNTEVWNRFKRELLTLPGLNNIHFMGGETLLTDRLEDLVDCLIEHQRFEICISFVTNGSRFKSSLMEKLIKFRRVGIEVSIENLGPRNDYIRQGFATEQILKNILQYQSWCNGSSVTLTLRPAPSLLSVGEFVQLLDYAVKNKFVVKSNLVITPRFLDIRILPDAVKQQYILQYQEFLSQFESDCVDVDYNASDPSNVQLIVKEQATQCLAALQSPAPDDADQLLAQMVDHCRRWDLVYNADARILYPELTQVWDQYDY